MELEKQFDSKKIEKQIKNYLSDIELEKKIFDSSNKQQKIMFIEGPPTMNGIPHIDKTINSMKCLRFSWN